MKKIFVTAFVSILLLAAAAIALPGTAKAAVSGDYTYTLDISGNATVTGYTGTGGNITIPGTLGGRPVTAIGDNAFKNKLTITGVTIPDSVTAIGSNAFYGCTGLLSLNLGNHVTSIGQYAFYKCSGLGSLVIPDSVTSIGSNAFYQCTGLLNLKLGNNVTSIGTSAFYKCSGLKSLVIPGSVTDIGSSVFSGCSGLNSLVIPDSVTTIGSNAFSGCSGLLGLELGNNVTSIGASAFQNCTGLTSLVIPASVTSIPGYAFYNCSGLISLTIPDSVTSIGVQAFSMCTKITEVNIGSGLKSSGLGLNAFYRWDSLKQYNVSAENTDFSSGGGVLFNKDKTVLMNYPIGKEGDAYTVPDSVVSIADLSFYGCKNLKSVALAAVTSIGNNAFAYSALSSVAIPDSVTSIGQYTFSNCSSLANVTLGSGISSIEPYMFYYCSGLTEITIPGNIKSIGVNAFGYCSSLGGVTIPDSVTGIGICAFKDCIGLTGITIPDSVTSIGSYAFENCNNLKRIDVGNGNANYSSLSGVLFNKDASALMCYPAGKTEESYWVPDGVTSIGDEAFRLSILSSVRIPDSVSSIGYNAFNGCGSLISAYFYGNAPASFEASVFYKCAPGFTVYYLKNKTGFTMPFWNGYNASDERSCDVLFDPQGGSSIEGLCVFSGTMINAPTEPAKTGYIFDGWYKDAEYADDWVFGAGSDAVLAAGVSATDTVTGNTTLYAKWEPIPCVITAVSNNISYGTVTGGGTYYVGAPVTLTATPEPGYLHYSWTDESGAVVSTDAVYTFTPLEDRTVTAVFGTVAAPAEARAISTECNSIEVSWNASAGADGYLVFRTTSETGTYKQIADPVMASYTDTKLIAGITYYYKVFAFKYSGDTRILGGCSETVSAVPIPPQVTGLKAAAAGITKTELTWSPAADVKGYEIWRSEWLDSGYVCIDSTVKTYYTDKGLTPNKTYYYHVRAYVKHGNSKIYGDFSNTAYAAPGLGTVTGLAASAYAEGIKLSWDGIPGSGGYEILRSTSPNGEYTVKGVIAQGAAMHINFNDKTCLQNTTYYYKIRAYVIIDKVMIYGAESVVVIVTSGAKQG